MMNDLIPSKVRKFLYLVYTLLGVAIGSFQTGFSAAELDQPLWLRVTFSVFVYVGIAFGIVAAGNIESKKHNFDKITPAS